MNVSYAENAVDYEIPITTQDTQYALALPNGVKAIEIQCRDTTDIRCSFTAGKVAVPASPIQTIKGGGRYVKEHLYLNAHTLYVAAGTGSKVVEVRVWL
ncbi:MAG: hypothetical protein JWP89_2634 [Schlesneria sp.]|nr:hypothetical protein [Schlesneria sp.]